MTILFFLKHSLDSAFWFSLNFNIKSYVYKRFRDAHKNDPPHYLQPQSHASVIPWMISCQQTELYQTILEHITAPAFKKKSSLESTSDIKMILLFGFCHFGKINFSRNPDPDEIIKWRLE